MPGFPRNLALSIRRLAFCGHSARDIAKRHRLTVGDVRSFLATPPQKITRGTDRQIAGRLGPKVMYLHRRGWSYSAIAAGLDLDPERVRDFVRRSKGIRTANLARPRDRAQQEALERNQRARQRRQARAPKKFVDEWKAAAATDPSYRDPVASLEAPEASVVPEIAAAELDQGDVNEPPRTVDENWGSPHGGPSGPRKLRPEIMEEILRLRALGSTWPELAARFGVHRRSIHAALRRR